jgi:hypothetical protein
MLERLRFHTQPYAIFAVRTDELAPSALKPA